jgi:hypothetical protein
MLIRRIVGTIVAAVMLLVSALPAMCDQCQVVIQPLCSHEEGTKDRRAASVGNQTHSECDHQSADRAASSVRVAGRAQDGPELGSASGGAALTRYQNPCSQTLKQISQINDQNSSQLNHDLGAAASPWVCNDQDRSDGSFCRAKILPLSYQAVFVSLRI